MSGAATADAIVAVATAPGRGGVGVVRVSCAKVAVLEAIAQALLHKSLSSLAPRQAVYGSFFEDGKSLTALDKGLAIYFPAPHSYTGEHVLELQGHGGPIVLQLLVNACLNCMVNTALIRIAEPGEFTRRAFLNDKIDLAQAEGVADLIEASTEKAARSAAQSLTGEFSSAIHALVEQVSLLRMLVEATLDFPDEEIDFLKASDARGKLSAITIKLQSILASATQGALLRNGLQVVLMGEPNVGKSSLLNALAQADVAIVTPIAGTTRDKVVQAIQINGVPLHIIDTAGLRQTNDEIEQIGISRTLEAIDAADVVLWLRDAAAPGVGTMPAEVRSAVPVVEVWNKVDLVHLMPVAASTSGATVVYLSAKTGHGLDQLRECLLTLAGWQPDQNVYLARERHLTALRLAFGFLNSAEQWLQADGIGLELMAEELRHAQEQLSTITGAFTADDLLGVIFSRFCIGK